ncbi:MAG: hypothetical protein ABFD52_00620 [Acidobacteriota bacterium]
MDDRFFGTAFTPNDTWAAWTILLKGLYGLPLDEDELSLFQHFTGRETARSEGYHSALCVSGRRSGKSRISGLITAYEALWGGHEKELAPGERGWAFCISNDRQQSQIVLGYVRSLLSLFPDMIERETADEIFLCNGTAVGVKTCSFKGVRGFSTIAVVADEIAFWRDENSANPAEEVITAILPSMKPNARLIAISTVYKKSGYLYQTYKNAFAKDSDELVFHAITTEMNPTFSQATIDRLILRDPLRYRSEFYSEFRDDISDFLNEDLVRGAATRSLSLPDPKLRYVAHIDPSGGRNDSFALAICHREGEKVLLDRIEERRPPFDPSKIAEEFAGILKSYGCHCVSSDRYAGEWVAEAFRKQGIRVDVSDLSASDLYLEGQALFTMARCEIINDERLIVQLLSLERRTGRSGKDIVLHPDNSHDDLCNAVVGALVFAARGTVWDEKEMNAHLPAKQHMSPLGRALDAREDLEKEMHDFLSPGPGGLSRIIRR